MSFVYLISEGEMGPVKIGVANDPVDRMRGLQTGNPKPLHLSHYWKMEGRCAAFALEKAILEEMSPYRMEGEWILADVFGMVGLIDTRLAERLVS